jgi:Protein of unknown function (DUF3738)
MACADSPNATMMQALRPIGNLGRQKIGESEAFVPGALSKTVRWSPDDVGSSDASLPSLFTALQEQLGLKSDYNKNPLDAIVIDHIERPSAK